MAEPDRHNEVVATTYATLAVRGVLTDQFQHGQTEQNFFAEVMAEEIERLAGQPDPAVLEAGCGVGAWIEALRNLAEGRLPNANWYGFDLTPEMIGMAEKRLGKAQNKVRLGIGDVLDDDAYRLRADAEYGLVYCYDVVQQLPPSQQATAVATMLRHVACGGRLVIFDHEAHSLYGSFMAAAKKLTRLGIPLLPAYYTRATYPKLKRTQASLASRPGLEATLVQAPNRRKKALIVTVQPDA